MSRNAELVRYALVVGAIALGVWLRFSQLGQDSVWYDEAHSALLARLAPVEIVTASATADINPPLYYLLLHWFTQVGGSDGETWLRMPSVLLGVAGIVATALAGVEVGGAVVGLWAAALVALSVFHVQYSREARMYSLLYTAATLSMYSFLRLRTNARAAGLLWIGCSVVTLFAHTVGVFVLMAEHLCWVLLQAIAPDAVPRFRRWMLLNLVVAVVAAPWALVSLSQHRRMGGMFWVSRPLLTQPIDVLTTLAGSFLLLLVFLAIATAAFLPGFQGSPSGAKRLPATAIAVILLFWGGAPLLMPWVASFVSVPIFIPRVTIAALAPMLVAVAFGLAAVRPAVANVVAAIILLMSAQLAWGYTHRLTKEDWRSVAAYLQQSSKPKELLLFHDYNRRKGLFYYVPRPAADVAGFPPHSRTVNASELPELDRLVEGRRRIWLVLASSNDPDRLIEQRLSTKFSLGERRDFRRVTVERFDLR